MGREMISPDNIIRPNGTRYSVQRNNMMTSPSPMNRANSGNGMQSQADVYEQRAIQYNLGSAGMRRE